MVTTNHTAELGLTALDAEITVDELPLHGAFPTSLSGNLLCIGPAKWPAGRTSLRH